MMKQDRLIYSVRRHPVLPAAILVLALAAYHAAMIERFGVTRMDGVTYFLLDDDPMISMRYGRNLASGAGLVYNGGERVEGFTNPLFTFLSAGLHLLPVSAPTLPLFVQLTSLLLSAGTLLMLTRFWGNSPPERFAGLAAAIFYLALPNHSYYAHSGFEVYMVIFILIFALWQIERLTLPAAFLVGLLPLTHATALPMWAVLITGILVVTRHPFQSRLALAAVAVLPFVGYEIFRIAYYHEILPNTYWLKAGAGSLSQGVHYAGGWLRSVWPLALLGAYSLFAAPGRRAILTAVVLVVHLAGVVALGGDIFPQFRFLFPCSVLLAAQAGASILPLRRHLAFMSRGERAYFRLAFAGLMVLILARKPLVEYRLNTPDYDEDKRWNIQHIAMGEALRDNTAPDAVVGLFGLGYAGYYSNRPIVDMLGKVDPYIARAKPIPGRVIGHNKLDFDYVLRKRQPDYLEMEYAPGELGNIERLTSRGRSSVWGYWEDLALHPVFRDRYAHQPLCNAKGRFALFYTRSPCQSLVWTVPQALYGNLPPEHEYGGNGEGLIVKGGGR
jgi:arabinofuranosyltransferase